MRIFIAGATGTLGLPLVRELVTRGHQVIGLTRSEAKRPILEKLGAGVAVADALDETAITRVVFDAHPDMVVHLLTAIPPRGPLRAADMTMTNRLRTRGTEYLLRAAINAGADRIVAESMVFAYGFGDHGEAKLREEDAPDPVMQTAATRETFDALQSLEEQMAGASAKKLIQGISLRFGLLYGPESPSTRFGLRMLARRMYPVVRNGDGSKPWVHSDDAVRAIVAALKRGRTGEVYNIVDNEPVSFSDFLLFTAAVIGAPRPRSVPLWFLRVTSPYAAASISTRLNVSNIKAKRELAWNMRFPNYREGLKKLASTMLREKKAA
jgi:nucleoside-diphosphate-sugar epimerase